MALISCPECGNMLSDKAPTCPHCGYDQSELITEYVWCPSCMSNHVQCRQKGVNIGRAIIGTAIGGVIVGALGATDDMNDMVYVCERCSTQFKFNQAFKGKKHEAEEFEQKLIKLITKEKSSSAAINFIAKRCNLSTWQATKLHTKYTIYNRKKLEALKEPNKTLDFILGLIALCFIIALCVFACVCD